MYDPSYFYQMNSNPTTVVVPYNPPSPPKLLRKTKQNERFVGDKIHIRRDIHKKRHTIIMNRERCEKGTWHFFVDLMRQRLKFEAPFLSPEGRDKEISRQWKLMHPEGVWTTDLVMNDSSPEEYQFISCLSETKFDLKTKNKINTLAIYCNSAFFQFNLQ